MATDPYKYFRVEARELLEQLGKGVLELEKGPPSADVVPRLLRFAHTLKGAARVVKQPEIADAAHSMEDVLASLREIASAVPQLSVDAILKLVDQMSNRLMLLTPALGSEGSPAARAVPDEPFRTVRADVVEMDALLDGVTETHVQLAAIRRNVQSLERASHCATLLTNQLGAPRAMETSRYDGALNRAKTGSLADELRGMIVSIERSLTAGVEQMDRELSQVRDAAERLRLVPAAVVFSSLERTARDTAQALGKRVVFEGKGHQVRLDAHVLAVLQGALVQLVRNSVAHGIESESARRAAGKSPAGRLRVEVSRRGKRVAFVCADDGRGVDVDAIRQAAQRKGLLAAETRELSPGKLLELLLEGGISTSGSITEVSGRGIGLDVVREAEDETRHIRMELLQRELEASEASVAKEIAETRAALIEELEFKNKELEAFSYSVSHDLRAPVRSIDGFSQLLLEEYSDKLDARGQEYVQRVRASAQRMGELIDDMLALSRVGRAELSRTQVNLSDAARLVAAEFAQREPGRSVECDIEDGLVAQVDRRLIQIVFENLLGNAWKYTGKVAAARIEFRAEPRHDNLVYMVRDNGVGFDMAFTSKLFTPFVRLHSNDDFPGTGIGLATVQRIIERHGGRVWAEGAVDQGATVYFTIPPATLLELSRRKLN
jgi:light-regulated signal transduction histidine kinase (bacteriophytochrome)